MSVIDDVERLDRVGALGGNGTTTTHNWSKYNLLIIVTLVLMHCQMLEKVNVGGAMAAAQSPASQHMTELQAMI